MDRRFRDPRSPPIPPGLTKLGHCRVHVQHYTTGHKKEGVLVLVIVYAVLKDPEMFHSIPLRTGLCIL